MIRAMFPFPLYRMGRARSGKWLILGKEAAGLQEGVPEGLYPSALAPLGVFAMTDMGNFLQRT